MQRHTRYSIILFGFCFFVVINTAFFLLRQWDHVIPALLKGHGHARAYSDPDLCSGACNARDPGLIRRHDGKYFRFATGNKIQIATADAIEGPWKNVGSMLPEGSSINKPGNDVLWAPDVTKVGDEYYIYYSVSTLGSRNSAIGLATSKTMEPGSWKDHGSIGVESDTSQDFNAIDPNLLKVGDKYYLQYGSYWGGIFQVELNEDATKKTSADPVNLAYWPAGNHFIEGSYLYHHGDYYYLFYSWGQAANYDIKPPAAGNEYHIKVCRSSSPSSGFTGPLGLACTAGGGAVVLASHGVVFGPGGQGVYDDPEHGSVIYYQYTNTTVGYATSQQLYGWNVLDFSSGWPTVV